MEDVLIDVIRKLSDFYDPDYPQASAWTSRICRRINGLDETLRNVAWCGLCRGYANPRKRRRSSRLPPILPGFPEFGGAFQIHDPCPLLNFKHLQYLLHKLKVKGIIEGSRVKIPDYRQNRGWDYATNWKVK